VAKSSESYVPRTKRRAGNSFAFGGANDGVTGAELLTLHGSSASIAVLPHNNCINALAYTVLQVGLGCLNTSLQYIMAQIPTPPPSRPGSEAADPAPKSAEASPELLQSLDVLLEQYLHLLDRQQKLQSGLAKQLSSVWPLLFSGGGLAPIWHDANASGRVFFPWPMRITPVLPAGDMVRIIMMNG
jgi:hypothetical protein